MPVAISAIICTRNRADFLEKCIQGLFQQTLARESYEIIVVDNGSTDNTADVLARYAEAPFFRVLHEPVPGLSRARNLGWKGARGQYVGYIDDDAVAGSRWLEDALWSFYNVSPEPAWVGGPVELEWETEKPDWIDKELAVPLGQIYWGDAPRWLHFPELLIGANSCFPKKILQRFGGFDERLGRQGANLLSGEETQLQQRIEATGGTLYYHPGVRIRHFVPRERTRPAWFYRRYYWGGVSDVFVRRSIKGLEQQNKDQVNPSSGRTGRMLWNLWQATGVFVSRAERIHARIYLAYVAGYLCGFLRWRGGRA